MGAVLIVDDEAGIRTVLARFLANMDHDIRTAHDAESALAMMAHWTPDVVVCDVQMPGANGLWLAERIRESAPTTAIVLATAEAGLLPHDSLQQGIVAYVLKPFQRKQVRSAVDDGMRWSDAASRKEPRSSDKAHAE
jgi:two-component system response regulator